MKLTTLEYANFALKSLVENRPLENFVFYEALNGILNFLNSKMNWNEKNLVIENIDVFNGITNILRIHLGGRSCIREIIEVNYADFNKLIDQFKILHRL